MSLSYIENNLFSWENTALVLAKMPTSTAHQPKILPTENEAKKLHTQVLQDS